MRHLLLFLLAIGMTYPTLAQKKKKEEAQARALRDAEYTRLLERAKEADALHQYASAESLYTQAWEGRREPYVLQRRVELRKMLGDTVGYCTDLSFNSAFLDPSMRKEYTDRCLEKDSADLAFYGLSPERYPDIVKVVRTRQKKNGDVQFNLSDRSDSVRTAFLVRGADTLFTVTDEMPEYPGGVNEMYEHWKRNKKYPDDAYDSGIQGKVFIEFKVAADGVLYDLEVVRSVYPSLDADALRMIEAMPPWTPGSYRGSPVPFRVILPVNYILR
ncbi:MAG TPA: energy transducer TonB [Flavobacteriales bacterium]